jgi:Protein of unknown function (DUF4065)
MRFDEIFGSKPPKGAAGFKLTFGEDTERTRSRLRELILYVSEKSKHDEKFGAIKLNKILYYADFIAFKKYGEPITGAQYMRLDKGPAPTHLMPVREDMLAKNEITIVQRDYWTQTQKVVKPLRPANLDLFSGREIALVDGIIDELWQMDAYEVSQRSHNRGWKAATERDAIPYEAIFLSDEGLDHDDIDWAYSVVNELGWMDVPF